MLDHRRAAAEFLLARTNRRKIGAGAGAELEEHRFAGRQAHDGFHVILDGLDEAGAALGIFVLGGATLGFARLAIVEPVAAAGIFPDAVLMVEADVEPHRRVECAVLIHAEPRQFIVENLAVRLAEVAVLHAPVCNRAADAMNELADRHFPLGRVLFAVKIFGNDDLCREHRPRARHFDVFLFEDDFAGVVSDLGRAPFPFDLVERRDFRVAEDAIDPKALASWSRAALSTAGSADPGGMATMLFRSGRQDFLACV